MLLCWAASACSSDEPSPGPQGPAGPVRRTVLVYMVAANTLSGYDNEDIDEMLAAADSLPSDARWLVYHAPRYGYAPRLVELAGSDTITLKHYGRGGSSTLARLNEVLDDVAEFAPAADYGLVLWSHSSGWVANGLDEDLPDLPYSPLSFGDDRTDNASGDRMNIATLRAAIKGRGIDYLYFDCCHMGTVEVMYELRDAARYVVCGPTETPRCGMPYDRNLRLLAQGDKASLVEAARRTFEYETVYDIPDDCAMTVVDLSGMERLAAATAPIYASTPLEHPADYVTNYYGTGRTGNFLDFGEYVNALAESEGLDPALAAEFNSALDAVVIYKAAPEAFYSPVLGRYLRIYTASGLSTYVFNRPESFTTNGYSTLQWAKDVASLHLPSND